MMKDKLKPCPFCGHEAELEHEEQEMPTAEKWYRVICSYCGSNSGWLMWAEAAIESWNKRYEC